MDVAQGSAQSLQVVASKLWLRSDDTDRTVLILAVTSANSRVGHIDDSDSLKRKYKGERRLVQLAIARQNVHDATYACPYLLRNFNFACRHVLTACSSRILVFATSRAASLPANCCIASLIGNLQG